MKTHNINYFDQLQGLRCIACLLVIADHCNLLGMAGHGGVAVCFFLALSGFLLVKPWIPDGEESFTSLSGILKFYGKKLLRLLPAYYFLVLLHAFLSGQYESLPGNLLFYNVTGHLWYIQQYLVMLLLFPAAMLLVRFLKTRLKLSNLIIAILILLAAWWCRWHITARVFYLVGNGQKQRFRVGLFMVGMSAGYLYKWKALKVSTRAAGMICDLAGAAIIAASVLSGGRLRGMILPAYAGYEIAYGKDFQCAVASAILILTSMANPDGLLCRFLKWPVMVFLGALSYHIYLVHPMLMSFIQASTASKLFIRVILMSVCVAYAMVVLEGRLGSLGRRSRQHADRR